MNIGIIGGGMMGLTAGYYLSGRGHLVTIIEKEKQAGGLCRSAEVHPGVIWDRFYHVILSTDDELLQFIDEIGLSIDVCFTETKTGFFTDGQLHSMSSTAEFIKFKPLSLIDKFRLGAGILYVSRLNNWKRLEKIYVKSWLVRVFGRRNYEKMWEPLLRSKLGTASERASAAFIWATIKRYYGTRHSSAKKEMMGCVRGGYHSILNQIQSRLSDAGVAVLTGSEVTGIKTNNKKRIGVRLNDGSVLEFDRVIATIPNPHIKRILPNTAQGFSERLEDVSYLSIICVLMVLPYALTPFYVTNLTDADIPFTGLIEATHVIPNDILGGRSLIYLPKYMPDGDTFFEKSDAEVFEIFVDALRRMFSEIGAGDIINYSVHRERYVQPIHEIDYSQKIPPMKTPIDNFYISNTTMIKNSTLNNNQVIKLARTVAEVVDTSS